MSKILLLIAILVVILCLTFLLINIKKTSNRREQINTAYSIINDTDDTISKLDNIIETCVVAINQKMVSVLKKEKNFSQSDKEEAFNECRKMVYYMTPQDILQTLSSIGVDTNGWINARIEYFVRINKENN